MATRARIRKQLDFGRLREALSGPRADSRSWFEIGRVDDDVDAVQWIEGVGWVADVTFTTGELAGDGPCPCRVMSALGRPQEATIVPVAPGSEVVIGIVSGNGNVQPVILGYLHCPEDPIPSSVNGEDVSETYAAANVVVKMAAGLNAELGPTVRVSATTKAALEAPDVALAEFAATQPYVRGTDIQTALSSLQTALNVYASALAAGAPTPGPVLINTAAAAATALATALTSFSSQVTAALSTRIKGE